MVLPVVSPRKGSPYPEDNKLIKKSFSEETAANKEYLERSRQAQCPKLKSRFKELARDESVHVKELRGLM